MGLVTTRAKIRIINIRVFFTSMQNDSKNHWVWMFLSESVASEGHVPGAPTLGHVDLLQTLLCLVALKSCLSIILFPLWRNGRAFVVPKPYEPAQEDKVLRHKVHKGCNDALDHQTVVTEGQRDRRTGGSEAAGGTIEASN